MGLRANILVGGITNIKVGTYGQAEGAAADIGFTKDGVTIANDREYYDIKVDQVVGTIGKPITDRKVLLNFLMSETTLDNLRLAMDYPAANLVASDLTMDADTTENNKTIYLNGAAPSGGTRKITLHSAIIMGNGEYTIAKDGEQAIAIQIEALVDTLNSNEFGTYGDSSVDTTAPTIVMTTPAEDGTVGTGSSDTITLTITEANNIDEGSVIYGSGDDATVMIFDIEDPTQTALVAGTIVFSQTSKTIIFTPTGTWAGGAANNYQIVVTTGLKDEAGNNLASVFLGHFVTV